MLQGYVGKFLEYLKFLVILYRNFVTGLDWLDKSRKKYAPKWAIGSSLNSLVFGDGRPPTFNDGNPYNGYINPYGIGLMTIPYYMEIMGV